ncbi:MAG: pyridoxal-phosphate dependent enzyme [Acidimicrobiales bacterium]
MKPTLTCTCGSVAPGDVWSCPRRGLDDREHVLRLPLCERWLVDDAEQNPFLRYRQMLFVYHEATAAGLSDQQFVELVGTLDEQVWSVDGRRFLVTPTAEVASLGHDVGARVWLKDETGSVSGSHKARHVAGLMVGLLARETAGLLDTRPQLAIASCGNAALAAAVVAAAAQWPIAVFVPPDGDPFTLNRLEQLGADVRRCPRDGAPGDPTYRAFQAAVADGAIPFGCQGPDNGRTIDGGRTMGWELAEQVGELDRVIVHVGGAALASGVFQGLAGAVAGGRLSSLPVFDTVQTEGCAPLARALHHTRSLGGIDEAARNRSAVMWPWETTPHSIASGILDDETYDWYGAVEAMLTTGGDAIIVTDEVVAEANELVRSHTTMTPSFTGSAGVAGLLAHTRAGRLETDDRVAVLITGIDRAAEEQQ